MTKQILQTIETVLTEALNIYSSMREDAEIEEALAWVTAELQNQTPFEEKRRELEKVVDLEGEPIDDVFFE